MTINKWIPCFALRAILFIVLFSGACVLPAGSALGAEEHIVNGGFEDGATGWNLAGSAMVVSGDYFYEGTKYAYFGQFNNVLDTLYQQVSIPSNAASAELSFWYNITSEDSAVDPHDVMNVRILDSDGNYLTVVDTFSNDDQMGGATSEYYQKKTFDMSRFIGQTVRVHFLVTTNSSLSTSFRIDDVRLVSSLPTNAPIVVTGNASNITSVSVMLSGTVNPNGLPAQGFFTWGKTTTSQNPTIFQSIGSETNPISLSESISELESSTTYFYRIIGVNSINATFGEYKTFTTLDSGVLPESQCSDGIDNDGDGLVDYPNDPGCSSMSDNDEYKAVVPIKAHTINPSLITDQSARLTGTVAPGGLSSEAFFLWRIQGEQSTNKTESQQIGNGYTNVGVNEILTGLSPDMTYEYQAWGVNSDYEASGAWISFTTKTNSSNPPTYQCSDGIDNDGDGLIDYPNDPGCENAEDNNEWNEEVPENQPPVASFTYTPENPMAGESITFDASNSYDQDGYLEQYAWSFYYSDSEEGYCEPSSEKITTFSYPSAGNYAVSLNVFDDNQSYNTITKTITVLPMSENTPPTLSFPESGPYAGDGVDPDTGDADTQFTFNVVYQDQDNDLPETFCLVTDGITEDGNPVKGRTCLGGFPPDADYVSGVEFLSDGSDGYPRMLSKRWVAGTYEYYFEASDGTDTVRFPKTGSLSLVVEEAPENEPQCSDGEDNDGDGLVDSDDPGCHTDGNGFNFHTYNDENNNEINVTDLALHEPSISYQFAEDITKKNIVYITHGWNSNVDAWANDMQDKLANKLVARNSSEDWDVRTYDWSDYAKTRLPYSAYIQSENQGIKLGKKLAEKEPEKVHFIGHSAGSNLIHYASKTLQKQMVVSGKMPPVIQATFLDAYDPTYDSSALFTSDNPAAYFFTQAGSYGSYATYAEQYVDTRRVPMTESCLPYAINYNVTEVGENIGWFDFVDAHAWPIEYYKRSIVDNFIPGFPYSQEHGAVSWPANKNSEWCNVVGELPNPVFSCYTITEKAVNFSVDFVTGLPKAYWETIAEPGGELLTKGTIAIRNTAMALGNVYWENVAEPGGELLIKSATGIVNIVDATGDFMNPGVKYALNLINKSPVWATLIVETPAPANILRFDYKFPRTDLGDGLFTVFVDETLIYSRDETLLEHNRVYSETRMFPGTLAPGKHKITFRLDSLSEKQSEILIANIEFQSISLEEFTDSIAPETQIATSGTEGNNSWFKSDAEITLLAEDNEGGVGVQKTEYSLDDGNTWDEYIDKFTISDEGIHTIQYRSMDWFNNLEEAKTHQIKIDKTTPEANISFDEQEKNLAITGIDNLSDVAVARDGKKNYILTDEAGNTLTLYFKKIIKRKKIIGAFLKGMQYNDDEKTNVPRTTLFYGWNTKKDGALRHLFQKVKVRGEYISKALYHYRLDKTFTITKLKGEKPVRETFNGLKKINLTTNSGELNFSFK